MQGSKLTKIQKLLIYGLKQYEVEEDDAVAIVYCMKEEDDQILMIDYLITHPQATHQEILNESGRILELRKTMTK